MVTRSQNSRPAYLAWHFIRDFQTLNFTSRRQRNMKSTKNFYLFSYWNQSEGCAKASFSCSWRRSGVKVQITEKESSVGKTEALVYYIVCKWSSATKYLVSSKHLMPCKIFLFYTRDSYSCENISGLSTIFQGGSKGLKEGGRDINTEH